MSDRTLADLAKAMRDIDFAMLTTHAVRGRIGARPMSNNGEVAYEGTSYFFTWKQSRMVADIKRDKRVALSFAGSKGFLGKPPIFIAVQGDAALITDKSAFAEHWNKDLERWFKDGIDTKGLVMIEVRATRINFWDGEDSGEVAL